ncbi:S8 family peptidase [Pseudoalteromonas spongiae]|uniref:S8 family peptidase n=1 Tax=Pseudoalteromonas spongiae TaxID=298657 RepID=UPI000C2CEF60|nr:S8 family serine peptidase [Pseudoalteromonas spongiae]
MTYFVKKGQFAVSICALSIATSLHASNTNFSLSNNLNLNERQTSVTKHTRVVLNENGKPLEQKSYYTSAKPRYIIELEEPSVLEVKRKIEKQLFPYQAQVKTASQNQLHHISSKLQQTELAIQNQQLSTIQALRAISPNIKVLRQFSRVNNVIVIETEQTYIDSLRQLPSVKSVSKDTIKTINLEQSVPLINADKVWELRNNDGNPLTGEGIVVAILDSGVDYTHPDLGGCFGINCRVTNGYDFHYNDNDPMDENGHGTHVAGIVGANGYIKGVAPDVTFHAYKVLNDDGWGYSSDIIAGIERAVDPDGDITTDDAVDIINMSLGGSGNATDPTSTAVNNAVDAGVVVVVAAGNDGYYGAINNSSPAAAEKAITVASSRKIDEMSSFSSKALTATNFTKPEITAPGDYIESTLTGRYSYGHLSGTSMAAPHVAGAVALLKQNNDFLNASSAKQLLAAGAIDLGVSPLAQGAGRLDILASLKATTSANLTALNFGTLDKNTKQWSSTKTFTIYNSANEAQTYKVSFTEGFPTGASISSDKESIVVAAKSSAELTITVDVQDTTIIPDVAADGIHHNAVVLESDTSKLRIPTYFENAMKLTLSTNSPSEVSVDMIDSSGERSTYTVTGLSPVIINVPDTSLWLGATYFNLDTSDLPVRSGFINIKKGISSHLLNLTENTEFKLDVDELTHVTGLTSLTDANGNSDFTHVNNYFTSTYFSKDTLKLGWLSAPTQPSIQYLAVGNLDHSYEFSYQSHYRITDQSDTEKLFLYQNTPSQTDMLGEDIQIDLTTLSATTFDLSNYNDVAAYKVQDHHYDPANNIDLSNDITKIQVFETNNESVLDKKILQLFDSTNAETAFIVSPYFGLSNEGKLRISDYVRGYDNYPIETPNNKLPLIPEKAYLSASIGSDGETISLYPFRGSEGQLYHDLQGAKYNIDSQYQFFCEHEDGTKTQLHTGTLNSHESSLSHFKDSCENLKFKLTFNNSSIELSANGSFYIPSIGTIDAYYYGGKFIQPALNKIGIDIYFTGYDLETKKTEIQINDGDWEEVYFWEPDSGSPIAVPLPLIEGNHSLSLRITFDGRNSRDVIYTLNDFFTYGSEAGEINDADNDGIPNDQDLDDDNDGYHDDVDAFPFNPVEWLDSDNDGIGNNNDTDDDNDGYLDDGDAFPLDATEWLDTDVDGIGNNADTDDDNDGVLDTEDAFPLDTSESVDTDSDGIGNNADTDDDNDGVLDAADAFPLDATEWLDTDDDGIGNNADTDDDNDGVNDNEDAFPLDATEWLDTDDDGIGNNADTDDDNDGVNDNEDAFPLDATESVDTDGDGIGNNADADDDGDGDGVNDTQDAYPLDANRSSAPDNNAAENTSSSSGGSLPLIGLFALISITLRRFGRK